MDDVLAILGFRRPQNKKKKIAWANKETSLLLTVWMPEGSPAPDTIWLLHSRSSRCQSGRLRRRPEPKTWPVQNRLSYIGSRRPTGYSKAVAIHRQKKNIKKTSSGV